MRPGLIRLAVAALLAAAVPTAPARSFIQASEQVSLDQAGLVADVRIEAARDIKSGTFACGTTYRARVLAAVKGEARRGQTLAFGFLGGLEVGHAYRVYLSARDTREAWAVQLSDRAPSEQEAVAWMEVCRPAHPVKRLFFRADRLEGTKPARGASGPSGKATS